MPATNEATFRALFDIFNTGDLSQLDSLVAAGYRDHDLATDTPSGRMGFRFMIAAVRNAFPDLEATILDIAADGDTLAARTRLAGTHRGEFVGVAGTDKPFRMEEMHFFRFETGIAVEHRSIRDRLDFLTQTGILPEMHSSALTEWSYVGPQWPARLPRGEGWNDQTIAGVQERHWEAMERNVAGTGPLGVSHLPGHTGREDHADHNILMSYAYVLALAARKKDRISVLDWGGGVGHYHLYNKVLLPGVEVDYHCFEVPRLCEMGRKLLPEGRFYDDLKALDGRRFDLVLSSSALHYFPEWRLTLQQLVDFTDGLLYVSRLQTVAREASFVVSQKPHSHGYMTRYLSWFINRREFTDALGKTGAQLQREFIYEENWPVIGAPEPGASWGFLAQHHSDPSRGAST